MIDTLHETGIEADVPLSPDLADQIEHSMASLIAMQSRPSHVRPTVGWLNDVPPHVLGEHIPERPAECRRLLAEVEGWLADLGALPAPVEWNPREILAASDPDHVAAMCDALGLTKLPLPPAEEILHEVSSAAGNTLANIWRRALKKEPISYDAIVRNVAALEKVTVQAQEAAGAIEDRIIRNRFIRIVEAMSPDQRAQLAKQFEDIAKQHGRTYYAEAGVGGLTALANASGFGVYMMASTVVGAVSHALGLGLAFGFYAAMSQTIAVLIPGGLAAAGALAAYKLAAPNRKKMVSAVLHIGAMRALLADRLERTIAELRMRQMELLERAGPAEDMQLGGKTTWRPWLRRRGWKWWVVVGVVGVASTGLVWSYVIVRHGLFRW